MKRLVLVLILTGIIHMVDTLSYSVRIAGVQTKRLAIALSLFNLIVLVSRLANTIQAPLLGSIVDLAIARKQTAWLAVDFREIILAATIGSVIGALLIPSFVGIFSRGILIFEETGSIPRLLSRFFSRRGYEAVRRNLKPPEIQKVKKFRMTELPKTFLILNVLITSLLTIGVLSSIYAGALIPSFRLTAGQLSGLVNGTATILLAMLVDPRAAVITDQALRGIRPEWDVKVMVVLLVAGKILGTLLGQLIFVPAAESIVFITRILARH
ncbi:MAG: lipid II flippase Amj family protein [Syntrophothermus sp.]